MQQLVITKGLPASGKSTWAKAWVLESPKDRVRVNRDDIRRMLGPYWVPSREKLVTKIERGLVSWAIDDGYSVILDATNFNHDWLTFKYPWFTIQDFTHVPLETCIERDKKRGKEMVGEKVIRDMYNKYLNK